MKILFSPTKSMKKNDIMDTFDLTNPEFINQANIIHNELLKWSVKDLKSIMKLSDSLAYNTCQYIKDWSSQNSFPAVLFYSGTSFKKMNPILWSNEDRVYAQNHLCILSAMYGLIRPYDQICFYRLEMGLKHCLFGDRRSIKQFWKPLITDYLNKISREEPLINLASNEYFNVIDASKIKSSIIHCFFYEDKEGEFKMIGNYAKAARGLMVNYMVKNKINGLDKIKEFNVDGYLFNENKSTGNSFVFIRKS
mgnify:CR=1 FL=1